jgi:hypothetical protein
MRNSARIGAALLAASLLGGCPARDYQTEPIPAIADGEPPTSQGNNADPANPAIEHGLDDFQPGETPEYGAPADDSTAADADQEHAVPGTSPLTPGTYTGIATIRETAYCSGLYAASAGPEAHHITDSPGYQVVIDASGLPDLEDQTVHMPGARIEYTFSSLGPVADGVTTSWSARIDFIDPETGLTYLSAPGTETNVYRRTASGALQIDFTLLAEYADQYGTVSYEASMTGELGM